MASSASLRLGVTRVAPEYRVVVLDRSGIDQNWDASLPGRLDHCLAERVGADSLGVILDADD